MCSQRTCVCFSQPSLLPLDFVASSAYADLLFFVLLSFVESLQAPGAETPATDVKAEEAEKTTEGEEAEKAPGNEDTAENGNEDGGDETETAGAQPVQDEDEFEEDDDLYDEHVVDLRNFRPLGGVVRLDLVVLPPQPKTYGAWTCQESKLPSLCP